MRQEIGVRELKNQLNSVIRRIREQGAEYTVTLHGQPIAELRPIALPDASVAMRTETKEEYALWDELAQEIGASWTSPQSGVELLDALREEEVWQ